MYYSIGLDVDKPELWVPEDDASLDLPLLEDMDDYREDDYEDELFKVVAIPLSDWTDPQERTANTREAARCILRLLRRDPAEVDAIDLNA